MKEQWIKHAGVFDPLLFFKPLPQKTLAFFGVMALTRGCSI
jgi:hypothetical protein